MAKVFASGESSKDLIGSLDDFTKCLEINPNEFSIFKFRGEVYFKLNELHSAIEDLNKAIIFNSNEDNAFLYRALAKINLGLTMEGCSDFSRAAELGNKKAIDLYSKFCSKPEDDIQMELF